jgi:hypothetical protein
MLKLMVISVFLGIVIRKTCYKKEDRRWYDYLAISIINIIVAVIFYGVFY